MAEDYFYCFTLVDITNTGVIRFIDSAEGKFLRNQQRNWETLVQSISMRAQPIFLESPTLKNINDLSDYNFGEGISGPVNVWSFRFGSEHTDIYSVKTLEDELHNVPINTKLCESIKFHTPVFDTKTRNKNTYFLRNSNPSKSA